MTIADEVTLEEVLADYRQARATRCPFCLDSRVRGDKNLRPHAPLRFVECDHCGGSGLRRCVRVSALTHDEILFEIRQPQTEEDLIAHAWEEFRIHCARDDVRFLPGQYKDHRPTRLFDLEQTRFASLLYVQCQICGEPACRWTTSRFASTFTVVAFVSMYPEEAKIARFHAEQCLLKWWSEQ